MGLSQKVAATTLGVLLLGGLTASGQNKVPGPDLVGIAETKAMHTAIVRAIEANTRAQIVIARLASQDARVAAAIALAADAQRELTEATRARADAENEIRRLTQGISGQSPEQKAEARAAIAERRAGLPSLLQQEQAKGAQLAKMHQALAAEQKTRSELSGRLDDLERSLALGR